MIQLASDITIHLESPLTLLYRLTQSAISGWIISRRPINQVQLQPSNQNLTLINRPDVRSAYPDYPYVLGYIGIFPIAPFAHTNTVMLTYDVGETRYTQRFRPHEKPSLLNSALRLFTAAKPESLAPEQSLDTALYFLRLVNGQLREVDTNRQQGYLLSTPLDINLETTNHCNLTCPTCARNYWDKNKNPIGNMSLDLLDKLTPFIERAQNINFLGYGESVLSPQFKPIVKKLAQLKPRFTLFNNGTTLGPRLADFILEYGFKSLAVSIDGATEATVQHTRTASLSKIINNIKYLRNRSQEQGVPCPDLSLSFTASRRNISELVPLVELAAQHGFKQIYVGLFKIFTPTLHEESLFLVPELARHELIAAKEFGVKYGIDVIIPPEFGVTLTCNQPFSFVLVKWDGSMRLCCSTAIVSVPPLYIEASNLYETSGEALWNGELAQNVRLGLLGKGEINPVCARCPYTGFNLERYTRYL